MDIPRRAYHRREGVVVAYAIGEVSVEAEDVGEEGEEEGDEL